MASTQSPPAGPAALDDATAETIDEARRRLDRDAADADALLVIATYYSLLGEPETSLGFLHRLSEIRPEYPGVWRVKARLYRELGDEDAAVRCEETALLYEGPENEFETPPD